jgi:Domain of unknown function (DUF4157)
MVELAHSLATPTRTAAVADHAVVLRRACDCGEHSLGGAECSECCGEHDPTTGIAPRIVDDVPAGPDRPLDPAPRASLGRRFGHDFSTVRVHTEASAEKSGGRTLPAALRSGLERRLNAPLHSVRVHDGDVGARVAGEHRARALAIGENLFFAPGLYRPSEPTPDRLLVHELVHVLQQRLSGASAGKVAAEAEAESIASRAASAGGLPAVRAKHASTPAAPLRNAQSILAVIEDELDDVFFGIDNAWPVIRKEPQAERDKVRTDRKLQSRIERRASPMDLLKTYLLLTYQTEDRFAAQYKAFLAATDITGTHEERVYTILRGVTSAERVEMRAMPGFRQVIVDEMSGRELRKALGLLDENIEQVGTATTTAVGTVHMESVERYKLDVEAAGESLEEAQRQIKAAVDDEGIDRIVNDSALWAVIADHFDIEELWYLRMITRAGAKERLRKLAGEAKPYVELIWEAVGGAGTKEKPLVEELRRVSVDPTERGTLVGEQTFVPMLEDELSGGDLRDAFAAIGVGAVKRSGIRDALEDAIDDHDMDRIRKLLKNPALPMAELDQLRYDPVILDEFGEELRGPQLCESVLLLKYGSIPFPAYVSGLLTPFQKRPIDVAGAETFLNGLSDADKESLLGEPGVYFMLSSSGLPYADMGKLLAAIRPTTPAGPGLPGAAYRVKGAEGTFKTHTETVTATLPVEFTTSEIRVIVRVDIDKSKMRDRDALDSDTLETWGRAVNEIWNGRFMLRTGPHAFPLVFVLYMAEGVASTAKLHAFDWADRSFRRGNDLYLYLSGYAGSGLEPKTVAHEFGHMLGYPDEYALPPGEYKRVTGEETKEPQTTVKALMGGHYESTKVELRYAGPATEAVNIVRDVGKYPAPFVLERSK